MHTKFTFRCTQWNNYFVWSTYLLASASPHYSLTAVGSHWSLPHGGRVPPTAISVIQQLVALGQSELNWKNGLVAVSSTIQCHKPHTVTKHILAVQLVSVSAVSFDFREWTCVSLFTGLVCQQTWTDCRSLFSLLSGRSLFGWHQQWKNMSWDLKQSETDNVILITLFCEYLSLTWLDTAYCLKDNYCAPFYNI